MNRLNIRVQDFEFYGFNHMCDISYGRSIRNLDHFDGLWEKTFIRIHGHVVRIYRLNIFERILRYVFGYCSFLNAKDLTRDLKGLKIDTSNFPNSTDPQYGRIREIFEQALINRFPPIQL